MAASVCLPLALSLLPKYRAGVFNIKFAMLTGRIYWVNISVAIYFIEPPPDVKSKLNVPRFF